MKKASLVALVALTASVMADDMNKSGNGQMMQRSDSGMMNVSSYPMIDSHKWDFFGDVLYWHTAESGTEWALYAVRENASETKNHTASVDFGWAWGFKVGAGYNFMNHDEWDTQLYYTWFRTDKEDHVSVSVIDRSIAVGTGGIFPLFTVPPSPDLLSGEINWRIHLNEIDWELGRGYYVSKHLSLRPFIGVKGAWINQHMHGHFRAEDFDQFYRLKNDFWGVGPKGGVNTKWNLGNVNTHFFSMVGDFAGALMWGHFNDSAMSIDPDHGKQEWTNLSTNQGASMLQAFLGFGWDTNFHRDMCHFSMKLGYEVQYWLEQNQFFEVFLLDHLEGDLVFQGGTLEARFDF